tara:strand:- start:1246 stop:1404 length:159 start_codon:yes stop_codon:yes gene_type:complete
MGLKTKSKIPGQDISHITPGLFPESFYEEEYDDVEYDDGSLDGVEIEYTTQA